MGKYFQPSIPEYVLVDSAVPALLDILAEYGVRSSHPETRPKLAEDLAADGMDADMLREVCEAMEATGKPWQAVAGLIGGVLKSRERWQAFLAETRRAAEARARRDASRRQRKPNVNQTAEPWTADDAYRRDCQYVRERLQDVGVTPEMVAAQMGWSVAEVLEVSGGYQQALPWQLRRVD